jgi:hypothetical protein
MDGQKMGEPLRFIDHHRLGYVGSFPIAGEGMFIISSSAEDGGLGEDGEFRVMLVQLTYAPRARVLYPRLEAFGDGVGALHRAIAVGLLDVLGPVESREDFSRRLLAIGMVDGSDEPLTRSAGEE